jgi:hypothetical protein
VTERTPFPRGFNEKFKGELNRYVGREKSVNKYTPNECGFIVTRVANSFKRKAALVGI